jgi:hypothetical protein
VSVERPAETPDRPATHGRRAGRAFDLLTSLGAAGLLGSIGAAAWHDVSRAWDVWYYHLPFAARLAGVIPAEQYVLHANNQARFAGFPLLGEALQGALWRVTGRAECANLVAFAAVPLLAWFLSRALRVPWQLGVLSLLAIPLVLVHATSCYVDLPANASASVVVLLAIRAHATRQPLRAPTLALAVLAAAMAANMKVMLGPIVLCALAALGVELHRQARSAPARAKLRTAVLALGALCLVFATPLKNAVLHGNPWYPIRVGLLGHLLPGTDDPYSSSPPWLQNAPQPLRFLCSLAELGIRPFSSTKRWTVDQWMPDSAGNRMGGFFGAYVVVSLGFFAWRAWRERSRRCRVAAIGFGALTLLIAFMPQSHELRYYMCWMMVLVALNGWLARGAQEAAGGAVTPAARALAAVSLAALGVVVAVSEGGYVYPSGSSFRELVREQVSAPAIDRIREGAEVCVAREPWVILWAAAFHPPRHYVVHEAEQHSDCAGYPRAD